MRPHVYCKSFDNGVISDTHCNALLKTHSTRRKDGLSIPSIKTNAFFNIFGSGQLVKIGMAFQLFSFVCYTQKNARLVFFYFFLHSFFLYRGCSVEIFDFICVTWPVPIKPTVYLHGSHSKPVV